MSKLSNSSGNSVEDPYDAGQPLTSSTPTLCSASESRLPVTSRGSSGITNLAGQAGQAAGRVTLVTGLTASPLMPQQVSDSELYFSAERTTTTVCSCCDAAATSYINMPHVAT
jgi:hypothetical protein